MKPGRVGVLLACASVSLGGAAVVATAMTASTDKHLYADMSGAKELSAKGQKGAGAKNGHGAAAIDFAVGKACFGLTVHGIATPTAAHIHKGSASKSGPVVVALLAPKTGNPGATGGCVAVKAAVAAAIKKNPGGYYVNVHTKDFPNGAVRGQLFSASK